MTSAVPVDGGADLRRALPAATRGGLLVAVAAIALGQIPPLLMNAFGAGLAVATQMRLGWLYTAASTGAALVVEGSDDSGGGARSFEVATIRVAVLSITAVIAWLAVRAGRSSARRVRDEPWRRAIAGALVAPGFAVPVWALAWTVSLRLEVGGIFPDVTMIRAIPLQVAVGSVVLGGVAGAIGGLSAGSGVSGRWVEMAEGGWKAFVWSLALAVIAVLVFAVARPSGLDGYVAQLRSLEREGAALVVGHQGLLAPNLAVAVLVPSMGSCDVVEAGGRSDRVVCLDRRPVADSPLDALAAALTDEPLETHPMPLMAWGFLAVPVVALVAGGRRAARDAVTPGEAAMRGAGAGLVFAGLVVLAIAAATVSISTRGVVADQLAEMGEAGRASFGPELVRGSFVAFLWGIGVGVAGGLSTRWGRRGGFSRRARPR